MKGWMDGYCRSAEILTALIVSSLFFFVTTDQLFIIERV
jgi:hypothetical protein